MKALVTGCAGFIGSHLSEELLRDGVAVLGIDCFNENYGRRQKLGNLEAAMQWDDFEFVPIDLARGDLGDLVAECDVVYHVAAEPGVRSSWGHRFGAYLRNNVEATQHLLDAARQTPEKRFVFASSSSVYGQAETFPTPEDALPRPFSPYGATKLAAEHLCLAYHANWGLDVVTLRLFTVYGPRQRPDMAFSIFCDAALGGKAVELYGDGRQTRDFTYVDDVVAALRAAASAPNVAGRVFNIGGGAQKAVLDVIAILERLAETTIEVRHVELQQGDVRHTGADISSAGDALGYEPSVSLERGLEAQFAWAKASYEPTLQR